MTTFAICVLLFVANLLVYQDAAILLPVTGGLALLSGVRLLLLRRKARSQQPRASFGPRGGTRGEPRQQQGCSGRGCATSRPRAAQVGGAAAKGRELSSQAARALNAQLRQEKKKAAQQQEKAAQVQREGNVLYASFPSTKEGRRRAMEAFSKEKPETAESDGKPLQ